MSEHNQIRIAGFVAGLASVPIVAGAAWLWLERGSVILLDLETFATALCL